MATKKKPVSKPSSKKTPPPESIPMILYVIHDSKLKTFSYPLLAPSLQSATSSLEAMNPSNLSDLSIYPITPISSLDDLLRLRVNPKINLKKIYPQIYQVE